MGEKPGIDASKMFLDQKEIDKIPDEKKGLQAERDAYQSAVVDKAHPAGEGGLGVLGRIGKRRRRQEEIIHEDALAEEEARKKAREA